ncbi:hypothetical protein [Streptomyces sp. NPDC051662]|uniref:hypothetical protein n=1 Tax=Streptomyces sp. NPDC051662 TaxID=3154750 RepID=UPI00342AC93C
MGDKLSDYRSESPDLADIEAIRRLYRVWSGEGEPAFPAVADDQGASAPNG